MNVSSTESIAAAGPVLASLKLYCEPVYRGVTSAIYVKPSSTFVYLLKNLGSYYFIRIILYSSIVNDIQVGIL